MYIDGNSSIPQRTEVAEGIPDPNLRTQSGMIHQLCTLNCSALAYYIPQQRDSHRAVPIDDEDPLENFAPIPKIGEGDPTFGEKALEQMIQRSVSALREYRSDRLYTEEIPDRPEKK